MKITELTTYLVAGKVRGVPVREALGSAHDMALDFHGRVSPAMARRLLPRLEPSNPLFVEEAVVPELGSHLPSLVAGSPGRLPDGGCAEW